ncbi:cytochrome-c oxidase, cbb3-type subunit I [Myxococcota bacterium]|nr:cytochrome-c oxidase, cbb3-type subunit I [Myxococcota bacterium]
MEHVAESQRLEKFVYDDDITRKFVFATVLWGIVGMLVGLIVAFQLVLPWLNLEIEWLTFGRLRPLHTNAVIFAFACNAVFAGMYYSSQRLLKTRMFSDMMSRIHFWGWQLIIVIAAITLPLGITQSKEYAELEWWVDLLITAVWVIFSINFFLTIRIRRERHLYVAIWFYIASLIAVAMLHLFNNLVIPVSLTKSYPIYSGVQDAFMQWWYGHNAVAFVLTTPFLGMMYYFMPKAAERPVYSYRLSILHFWTLIFLYIWAGPHHLHYTALPGWASTLGMVFSIMLWMPSWGGMINGLLTLRGAWHKVARDPVLKFMVVAITFYGMSTFEGPLLSIKSVNALGHYTDWIIGHVHNGTLGWNGFLAFGMVYWLMPRLFQNTIWKPQWVELHFWIGTIGILLYIVSMYVAGITQGLMWRAFDPKTGLLAYPDFVDTVMNIRYFYWGRALGGTLYLTGAILCGINLYMTWATRTKKEYDEEIQEAPALQNIHFGEMKTPSRLRERGAHVADIAYKIEALIQLYWHRKWERLPLTLTVMVVIAVGSASLFEIIPTFAIKSNVPKIASVKPYTPLELAGRDIYVSEGCYNCHSQMVRPMRAETERYNFPTVDPNASFASQSYSKPGEFIYDHPFQWGSRRIGPDLHREGGRRTDDWHYKHMMNPRGTQGEVLVENSIMPPYPWLAHKPTDFSILPKKIWAMRLLGVPYTLEQEKTSIQHAKAQAKEIADRIRMKGIPGKHEDKQIIALIAYLQRLGTDILKEYQNNRM